MKLRQFIFLVRHGFTLLEAIMAVALFGLLMMAVASLWNVCWRASERIRQAEMGSASPELVLKRLSQSVEGSIYRASPQDLYAWRCEDDRSGEDESDILSFVTARAPDGAEAYPEFAPLERIRISARSDSSGRRQLVLQAAPFTMEEGAWQRETVLMENVKAFRVKYKKKDQQDWDDGWRDEKSAPVAVQMGITLPGETVAYAQEQCPHQAMGRVHTPISAAAMAQAGKSTSSGTSTNAAPVQSGEAGS